MPSRKDTAKFIAEARAVHGDRYDYSRVVYIECRKRVEIICPVHGAFWQTPDLHIKGRNCRKCSQQKRTEGVAVYCRFCGVRVLYDSNKKRSCESPDCYLRHRIERNRKIGNEWLDCIRHKISALKKRTRQQSQDAWLRKCSFMYSRTFIRGKDRIQKTSDGKQKTKANDWEEFCGNQIKAIKREFYEHSVSGFRLKVKRFCSSSAQHGGIMAARKGSVSRFDLYDKVKQQGFKCALSGLDLTIENAVVDHIHPVACGGATELDNLQWVHKEVNRMKGRLTQDEFILLCSQVAQQNRQ